jgi:3-oxoacyl-[acyl-carrier-protein] synthase I
MAVSTAYLNFLLGEGAVCALARDPQALWSALLRGETALRTESVPGGFASPVARVDDNWIDRVPGRCRVERMSILAIRQALASGGLTDQAANVQLVWCSAKGNIDALYGAPGAYHLGDTARNIAAQFGMRRPPLVVSTACASGVVGLVTAHRLLNSGRVDLVVVAGADVLSPFTLLGFQTLQAVSPQTCRPYDRRRRGTNLGEAGAAILLGRRPAHYRGVRLVGGATSNDAAHISRPSQDGTGLYQCIRSVLRGHRPDFISGHGTGTEFNDEMEAAAFHRAGLSRVPVHSLKGYFGHTLGACGVLETIVCRQALETNTLLPSAQFEIRGTRHPLRVIRRREERPLRCCLKTAAGFGGSNAVLLLEKTYAA